MDMSALRVFAAVAREGGVTRAAWAQGTVPSSITTRIQELEQEIGLHPSSRATAAAGR